MDPPVPGRKYKKTGRDIGCSIISMGRSVAGDSPLFLEWHIGVVDRGLVDAVLGSPYGPLDFTSWRFTYLEVYHT